MAKRGRPATSAKPATAATKKAAATRGGKKKTSAPRSGGSGS